MRISAILRQKGGDVAKVHPDETVRGLLGLLAEKNIGAAVVSGDGVTISGIVSERDVVRHLHRMGGGLLDAKVSSIMTSDVHTCAPDDDLEGLRVTMTERRFRHVPVIKEGRLVGIVSIGDVVKSTISELEDERAHLVDYIQTAG